jgi:cleavage and polyadenylation specificity factor subunit 1
MQITKDKLAIIPFRQEHAQFEPQEPSLENGSKVTTVLPSFIVDLQVLDGRIRHIRAFEFLHGYYEPTIAVLIEPMPTWAG